jgi:hypothetical protein
MDPAAQPPQARLCVTNDNGEIPALIQFLEQRENQLSC